MSSARNRSTICSTKFPAALQAGGPARRAAGAVGNGGRAAADRARRARRPAVEFHRRRRLRASHPGAGVGHRHARRILFRLHALSGGGEPGHVAADLRIPVDDVRADRHGGVERVAVRRRLGAGRGLSDGGARQSRLELAAHPAAAHGESDLCAGGASHRRQSGHRHSSRWISTGRAGRTPLRGAAAATSGQDFTALVLQQPNFFGSLEEVDAADRLGACQQHAGDRGGQSDRRWRCSSRRASGAVSSGGTRGADIVCGEGQPLGVPLASGGPYFGFMATRMQYVRQMPGRIVGAPWTSKAGRASV